MAGPGVAGSGGQARREDAPDDGGAERAAQLAQNVVGRPGQARQFGGDGLDRDRGAGRDDRAAAGADNDEAPGEVAQTGSAVDAEQRDKANDRLSTNTTPMTVNNTPMAASPAAVKSRVANNCGRNSGAAERASATRNAASATAPTNRPLSAPTEVQPVAPPWITT